MATRRLLIALFLLIAAARCSSSPRTLSFAPAAADVQAIVVQDVVRGPEGTRLFPMEARYTLQRAASGFSGPAAFSVGSTAPRTAAATVLLPMAAVEQFLQTLSGALLREGYAPRAAPSGGASPDVRIEMTHRSGALTLFTRSPGADFLPWAVEFEGRTYTIESTAPAKAFEALRPHLKREILDTLAREAIGGR